MALKGDFSEEKERVPENAAEGQRLTALAEDRLGVLSRKEKEWSKRLVSAQYSVTALDLLTGIKPN